MHSNELGTFIAEVTDKVRAGQQALVEIGRRRTLIAFDAHRGDKKAKVELAELAARIPVIEAELSDLEAAMSEARRRLDEALAKETRERRISDARETLKAIEKAKEAAAAADAAADAFYAAVRAYDAELAVIRTIGVVTEFSRARPDFIEYNAIQAVAPNKPIFPGLGSQGTRILDLAKQISLPGDTMCLLREADKRGE